MIINPVSEEEYELVPEPKKAWEFEFQYNGIAYYHSKAGKRYAVRKGDSK